MKAQVSDIVKHNKAEQQAKLEADKLLAALKDGKGDEAMKAAGLSFGAPQTLSRTGQDPLSQLAFTLPLPQQGKPVYGVGSNMQGDVVLVALDEVKAGSMPEEQKKAMVQGITQNNAQIAFEALMSNLRKAAKLSSATASTSSSNFASSRKNEQHDVILKGRFRGPFHFCDLPFVDHPH
ncbi:peptidyl-prolyl cis-trans isomerase D [Klebsiella pneumoniae]|nr:peptidyl-prolyl cis-trans isomerase D [Klebsiella pneumoniae]